MVLLGIDGYLLIFVSSIESEDSNENHKEN